MAQVILVDSGGKKQRGTAMRSPIGVVAMPQTSVFTKSMALVSIDCFWAVSAIWK